MKPFRLLAALFSLALSILLFPAVSAAQAGGTGTVIDPDGAAVPGARVEVRGSVQRVILADGQGNFELPELPPGEYMLRTTAQGFGVETRSVALPFDGKLEIRLNVAEAAVTVTAEIGQATDRANVPQAVSIIDNSTLSLRTPAVLALSAALSAC